MGFFVQGTPHDLAYRNIRDLEKLHDAKNFVEALWEEYQAFADRHFLVDATSNFIERFWEMYLAVCLLRHGYDLHAGIEEGPDYYLYYENIRIQVEATAPGPGEGSDKVPELKAGIATQVPEDQILLRFRGSIESKLQQFRTALKKGIVKDSDAYIVAINGNRIQEALGEWSLPYIVKSVLPFGDLTLTFSKDSGETTDTSFQYRGSVKKKSRNLVSTDIFLSAEYGKISAVLYSWCDPVNRAEEIGNEFILVHNPNAEVQIPRGIFRFGQEYWIAGDTLKYKNWNDMAT